MKRTHLIKKISYSMLATSLVLGLSPATFAVAETAGSATKTVIAADASDVVATDGTFTFADSGVTASADANSSNYKVSTDENGAQVLTIKEAGTYEITGSCSNGYVEVKKGLDGVTLILNGLTLSSSGEKTIKFKQGCTNSAIVLKGTNTLSSSNDKGIIKANAVEASDDVLEYDSEGHTTGGDLTIAGSGTLNLKSSYKSGDDGCDAINCEGDLTVLGGTFNIDVTDDGMHADNTLTIGTEGAESGPAITITSCEEGLEGATVNLYSGSADIVSSDDGINAANKDLTSYNWQYAINIAGGEWSVVAGGDGIDSNGNLTISGGTTIAYCTGGGNGALDIGEGMEGEIRGTFSYTGGTVLAVGSDMLVTPSKGAYVLFGGQGSMGGFGGRGQQSGASSASSIVTKGSTVAVSNGSKELLSTKALASGSYAIFMDDSVTSGTSYTLNNGSSSTTATASTGSTNGQQGGGFQQGNQQGNQQDGGFQRGGDRNNQQGNQQQDSDSGQQQDTDNQQDGNAQAPADGQQAPQVPGGNQQFPGKGQGRGGQQGGIPGVGGIPGFDQNNGQQQGGIPGIGGIPGFNNGQQQPPTAPTDGQQPPALPDGAQAPTDGTQPPALPDGAQAPEQGQAPTDGQQPPAMNGDQQAHADGQTPPEAPADSQATTDGTQPPAAPADGQQPPAVAPQAPTENANDTATNTGSDATGNEQAADSGTTENADAATEAEGSDAAAETADATEVKAGDTVTAGSGASKATYKVVKLATATSTGTVTYTKSKSSSKTSATVPASVKIDGKTYTVTGIAAKAFKDTKVKTVTVKSAKLTKGSVKDSLAGSKVTTVKVKVASKKKANKAYVSKYTKIFKKSNSGKKVAVK